LKSFVARELPVAPRPFWTGYLKLSLVTCPVAMTPARTEAQKVRFHTLNRKTGDRVATRYLDAQTGKVVDDDDLVKGYERGEEDYVPLEDDELDAVALETTRTIDIERFVAKDTVDWIWYDRPHFLTPDGEIGVEAFSVIRDAMAATKTVGLSRLVLYRRERPVLLLPRDRGIVVWTLRYGDEVREAPAYFSKAESEAVEPKLMSLISTLIEERMARWTPSFVADPIEKNLKQIIAAKEKGARPATRAKQRMPAPPSNVVSIMAALKKSLEGERRRPKKS
jgi:DNA end-binding protein Ku